MKFLLVVLFLAIVPVFSPPMYGLDDELDPDGTVEPLCPPVAPCPAGTLVLSNPYDPCSWVCSAVSGQ